MLQRVKLKLPGKESVGDREPFWTRFGLPIVLLLPFLFMMLTNETFRRPDNLLSVLQQASIIGIIAVGQTAVLILGGFDLSVGSVAALSGVIALLIFGSNGSLGLITLGILVGVAVGALSGSVNGTLISWLRINPLIATLGMLTLIRGLVLVITGGELVYAQGGASRFTVLALGTILSMPVPAVIFFVVVLFMWGLLRLTTFGQYIFAIGSSEAAATLSGIPVRRTKLITYILCALLAGLAGIILAARTGSALPTAAETYELQAISAAVIGGVRLNGGKGSVWGTVLGVLMLAVVANGLNLYGVSPFWQPVVTGAILLIAVALYGVGGGRERTVGA